MGKTKKSISPSSGRNTRQHTRQRTRSYRRIIYKLAMDDETIDCPINPSHKMDSNDSEHIRECVRTHDFVRCSQFCGYYPRSEIGEHERTCRKEYLTSTDAPAEIMEKVGSFLALFFGPVLVNFLKSTCSPRFWLEITKEPLKRQLQMAVEGHPWENVFNYEQRSHFIFVKSLLTFIEMPTSLDILHRSFNSALILLQQMGQQDIPENIKVLQKCINQLCV